MKRRRSFKARTTEVVAYIVISETESRTKLGLPKKEGFHISGLRI